MSEVFRTEVAESIIEIRYGSPISEAVRVSRLISECQVYILYLFILSVYASLGTTLYAVILFCIQVFVHLYCSSSLVVFVQILGCWDSNNCIWSCNRFLDCWCQIMSMVGHVANSLYRRLACGSLVSNLGHCDRWLRYRWPTTSTSFFVACLRPCYP